MPPFVQDLVPSTGAFKIATTNADLIGHIYDLKIMCKALGSGIEVSDTLVVSFKRPPTPSPVNPCTNDRIYFQSLIQDFTYTISYPANQLFVNLDYN